MPDASPGFLTSLLSNLGNGQAQDPNAQSGGILSRLTRTGPRGVIGGLLDKMRQGQGDQPQDTDTTIQNMLQPPQSDTLTSSTTPNDPSFHLSAPPSPDEQSAAQQIMADPRSYADQQAAAQQNSDQPALRPQAPTSAPATDSDPDDDKTNYELAEQRAQEIEAQKNGGKKPGFFSRFAQGAAAGLGNGQGIVRGGLGNAIGHNLEQAKHQQLVQNLQEGMDEQDKTGLAEDKQGAINTRDANKNLVDQGKLTNDQNKLKLKQDLQDHLYKLVDAKAAVAAAKPGEEQEHGRLAYAKSIQDVIEKADPSAMDEDTYQKLREEYKQATITPGNPQGTDLGPTYRSYHPPKTLSTSQGLATLQGDKAVPVLNPQGQQSQQYVKPSTAKGGRGGGKTIDPAVAAKKGLVVLRRKANGAVVYGKAGPDGKLHPVEQE